jgi:hypothetical protein
MTHKTATLYSLPAFKSALKEGRNVANSAKFARHVATEMAQDGCLDSDVEAEYGVPIRVLDAEMDRINAAMRDSTRPRTK